MPREGFNSPTVPNSAYELAKKQAEKEDISVSQVIVKAIQRYVNQKNEKEETIKDVLRVLDKLENPATTS